MRSGGGPAGLRKASLRSAMEGAEAGEFLMAEA